jgi:hypothetical protein
VKEQEMSDPSVLAARYRSKAEKCRAMKGDLPREDSQQKLEEIARDYERMAEILETNGKQNVHREEALREVNG